MKPRLSGSYQAVLVNRLSEVKTEASLAQLFYNQQCFHQDNNKLMSEFLDIMKNHSYYPFQYNIRLIVSS